MVNKYDTLLLRKAASWLSTATFLRAISSSSIGTATLVGYGLLNYRFYRVPLPAARQTPQLGGPVIRTFQLPPPGVPHV